MTLSIKPYWVAGLAVLLFGYPASFFLPSWTGWENGPVEDLQVVAYAIGFLQAGIIAYRSEGNWRALWLAVMPIWFLLAMRELSWGAVFHNPSGFDKHGPTYAASQLLWYNAAVGPMAAAIFLLGVGSALKGKVWKLLPEIARQKQIPWIECLAAGVCVILMTATEHHMGMSLDAFLGEGQIFEEMAELAAGIFLLTAQQRVRIAAGKSAFDNVDDRRAITIPH
jgi:hypothetical protein